MGVLIVLGGLSVLIAWAQEGPGTHEHNRITIGRYIVS